jgi:RNA polymerase-binding transcription factor DksA
VSARERDVVERFVASVEALAADPAQLVDAVAFGLDRVLDELLRNASRDAGVDAEEFSATVEREDVLRSELQARLGRIFQSDAIERARTQAHIRDLERQLQLLRYTLRGAEPDPWVWRSVDRDERARLNALRESGRDGDVELLASVERALTRLRRAPETFDRCQVCGHEIPADRLRLLPWAERCTPCQRSREGAGAHRGRPRVPVTMFFEAGRPVLADRQTAG